MSEDIVAQDEQKVKIDIDKTMKAKCPQCGIRGHISVGGIGNEVTIKCRLCGYQGSICTYPGCQNPAQPGRPLCAGCEEWENAAWCDHADELRQYAAVSAGVG